MTQRKVGAIKDCQSGTGASLYRTHVGTCFWQTWLRQAMLEIPWREIKGMRIIAALARAALALRNA